MGEERQISSDYARMCSYRNSEKGLRFFTRKANKCSHSRLNKNGFITAVDILQLLEGMVVDVIQIAYAHVVAEVGNRVPRFTQNVPPAQDDLSDGILQSVDQPGGEDFLCVHFPDQLLQFLGALLNFCGEHSVCGALVILASPVIQLVGLLLNLRLNVEKPLQELLALQLFVCHGCSFRMYDKIERNLVEERTKVRIMIISYECLFVKR